MESKEYQKLTLDTLNKALNELGTPEVLLTVPDNEALNNVVKEYLEHHSELIIKISNDIMKEILLTGQCDIDKYQRVIMDLSGGGTITVERNNVKSDLTYDENIRQAMLTALRSEVEKLEIKFKAL
jgi:hypothetical protein